MHMSRITIGIIFFVGYLFGLVISDCNGCENKAKADVYQSDGARLERLITLQKETNVLLGDIKDELKRNHR